MLRELLVFAGLLALCLGSLTWVRVANRRQKKARGLSAALSACQWITGLWLLLVLAAIVTIWSEKPPTRLSGFTSAGIWLILLASMSIVLVPFFNLFQMFLRRSIRRAMEGRRPRREARDSPEGALSHCVSLRASDSEVAQVSAGRSRQKESLAASPRAPGGLGCPVAQS
jgi:hypothetical protein